MRWWAFWRRVQYSLGFLVVCALIGWGLYVRYGIVEPTCFDGIQNGTEENIDCGGTCERICEMNIKQPVILWAQAFKIIDGQYNVVAYIENRNTEIGTPKLPYTLTLSDDAGVITEIKGETVFPPNSVYPIFEGRIQTNGRVPTKTTVRFDEDKIVWIPGKSGKSQFSTVKRELSNADTKPVLTAQIYNNSLDEAKKVRVVATIFNAAKQPLTAAATYVDYIPGRKTQEVTFTWPEPIAKTLRSCEVPTDVVLAIDLSGSMNNDGSDPPEPLTSVLRAAEAFVLRMNPNDQISLVTYASDARVQESFTNDTRRVAEIIQTLQIDPKEEKGTTNTGAALERMREELESERHNPNARKVAILLTDGLATAPTENPEQFARDKASLVKATGSNLFTIGLGAGANDVFLRDLAPSESQYFKAPVTKDLDSIYTSITESICEDGASVIEIIPIAESSFVSR